MDIDTLLKLSVEKKASDLHLSPNVPPMIRVDGDLVYMENQPVLKPDDTKALVYATMSADQKKEFEADWELDFAYQLPSISRFRVNAFSQANGTAAVFRSIPEKVPTLEQLNMPEVFKNLMDLPNGIILVTGPTGSGKSTTLAAMVDYINTSQSGHIITIEDPIEFTHQTKKSLVNQRQVGRDTKSFNAALRSALREDPDVILVGEMRDLETIRLALTAAETGHLVLATLHTSSAPRTVNRIVDVFPAGEKDIIRNILSESLQAVICQTLLKKVNGGRVSAFEIMLGTGAVRNLIREDKVAQMYSAMQTGAESGMCTLDQYIQNLLRKQEIDLAVAQAAAVNKSAIQA